MTSPMPCVLQCKQVQILSEEGQLCNRQHFQLVQMIRNPWPRRFQLQNIDSKGTEAQYIRSQTLGHHRDNENVVILH
jgi:hypothetical protein